MMKVEIVGIGLVSAVFSPTSSAKKVCPKKEMGAKMQDY